MAKGYGRPPMGRKGGKGMGMPGLNMDMIKAGPEDAGRHGEDPGRAAGKGIHRHRGGGVVSRHGGRQTQPEGLTIDPEAVDPEDVEMLQDMVIAAVNEAIRAAMDDMSASMGKITGGMNLPF